jgi:DUF4097 and DUF4098 domain-containing protein YvlB
MENFIKQNLLKLTHPIAYLTIFVLFALGSFAYGQGKSVTEDCKDKKNNSKKSKKNNPKVKPQIVNTGNRAKVWNSNSINSFVFRTSARKKIVTEKSIDVHPKVYISLCILQGNIKVNGWGRNEARVFINGRKNDPVGFKVRERDKQEKKPVWIQIVGYDPKESAETNYNTCLSGDIEIDVPKNASIRIQNTKGESETSIDSVRNAKVEVLGGDIYLSNISDRIDANTYQGGVTVRNSSGKMSLSTTTGNIVAYNTYSQEFGDYFKAKTRSGAITLQSVEQKEVFSSSISGSINYVGKIREYGKYDFSTTNGSINLAIPASTSCQLIAAYGGSFQSELPLKNIAKERTSSLVFLRGQIGDGEANLNLKSFNGTISIREKKESVLADF